MTLFHAPLDSLPLFGPLFQRGVGVTVQTGSSLEDLLCCQWQIDHDYVMRRISTLFLDSQPVDDLSATIVQEGMTLALSGAMPGLIGATMRRGGILASFRSGISYCQNRTGKQAGRGRITLKLFNLLIDELGPAFLARGIWVPRHQLAALFPEHPEIDDHSGKDIEVTTARRPSMTPA